MQFARRVHLLADEVERFLGDLARSLHGLHRLSMRPRLRVVFGDERLVGGVVARDDIIEPKEKTPRYGFFLFSIALTFAIVSELLRGRGLLIANLCWIFPAYFFSGAGQSKQGQMQGQHAG